MTNIIKKTKSSWQDFRENRKLQRQLTTALSILVTLGMYFYFLTHKYFYTKTVKKVTDYNYKIMILMTVASLVLIGIALFHNTLPKWLNKAAGVLFTLSMPVYTFIVMETVILGSFSAMGVKKILLNLMILYVLLLVLIALTNSLRMAGILLATIGIIFSIANSFIYEFRGIPIMASDIATIQTAANVASNYTLVWTFQTFFGLFAIWAVWVVGMKIKFPKICRWQLRIVVLVLTCAVSYGFVQKVVLSDWLSTQGIGIKMFKPMESYRNSGSVLTFVRSIEYAIVKAPEGYSVEAVEKIIEKYDDIDVDYEMTDEEAIAQKPNVIAIVNETFSDLSLLGDFTTNEDYMPYWHSLCESDDVIYGTTYASIIGGMTANTEFEFLTNNTMAFLPSQSVIFQLYIKNEMPSLATALTAQGYTGAQAVHMHMAENYNRENVYPLLGFSQFINRDNYEGTLERVRRYPTDAANYRVLTDAYESRTDTDSPWFIYDLTIQNHSPYDQDYSNFEQTVKLAAPYADADAQRYLNLIKYSDQAFEELTNYYKEVEEPTVIIMFGDHQPRLSDNFLKKITENQYRSWNDEEMMKRYAVPFMIWTNYDIAGENLGETSMNYLQTILMQVTGNELTGYQKFLANLREEVPVITAQGYIGADGKFYQISDKSSPYYEKVWEYSVLQYNCMFDQKNRVDSFFYSYDQ